MRAAPDATRRVSDAMAERYGLSADDVYSLMSKGRFRVKANVDQATADRYAHELEALGARVCIEEVPGSARHSDGLHGRLAEAGPRAHAGTLSGASRSSSGLLRPDRNSSGLLRPLREEIRDRAADPAACGPRQRMGPSTLSSPLQPGDSSSGLAGGTSGLAGPSGRAGPAGLSGPSGLAGPSGRAGPSGPAGPSGLGPSGLGPSGLAGPSGAG